ncbi:hypothetical protein ABW19_dt0208242 [Dactylella cylindrospora]|nr:hypothetical protein ABW19_dt0208242 [Dactylella cylindrospora]
MRLFVIPLTPRRAFVYGHRVVEASTKKPSILDRAITKSSNLWLQWEKYEKGWQKQLTVYGNKLLRQISYEEWSLKSIPTLSRNIPGSEREKVPVVYPPSVMTKAEIPKLLRKLGTEKSGQHRRLLIWSIVGMPIVAPFALLEYRTYHFSIWHLEHIPIGEGGRHLEFLVKNNLLDLQPDTELDRIYKTKIEDVTQDADKEAIKKAAEVGKMDEAAEEHLQEEFELIEEPRAKEVAEVLKIPPLVVELERACEQVHEQLEKRRKETYYHPKPPRKDQMHKL